jgi:hypothetical protein
MAGECLMDCLIGHVAVQEPSHNYDSLAALLLLSYRDPKRKKTCDRRQSGT